MNIYIIWLPGVLNCLFVCAFAYQCGSDCGFPAYLKNRHLHSNFLPETCRWMLESFYFILNTTVESFGSSPMKEKILSVQLFMRTLCYIQIEKYYVIMTLENKSSCTYNPSWRPSALSDSKALWHSEHRALHCLLSWKQPAEDEDSSTLSFHKLFFFSFAPSCRYFSAFHPWRSSN